MRIVHDIETRPIVIVGASLYAKMVRKKKASGFKVSATIITEESPLMPESEIHIEGSAKYVRAAVVDLLEQIDLVGDVYVEEGHIPKDWKKLPPRRKAKSKKRRRR